MNSPFSMPRFVPLFVAALGLVARASGEPARGRAPTASADNELTAREKREGWLLLFDGKTLNGWKTSSGTPSRTPIEEEAINPHRSGGYMLVHERLWSDFVLSLDFKISKGCNSGVFVRTFPLAPFPGKDVGWNGLEVAIDDTAPNAGYHDTGALYDLVKPAKNAMRAVGQWNRMVIACRGPVIDVEVNGEAVTHADLGRFTEPYQRPDGSMHKFDRAMKDQPRRGYIGLQDHGSPCWFKNIKLRPLP